MLARNSVSSYWQKRGMSGLEALIPITDRDYVKLLLMLHMSVLILSAKKAFFICLLYVVCKFVKCRQKKE